MFSIMIYRLRNQFPVAVKIMDPSTTSAVTKAHKKTFQKEVLLLSKMKHDNIVKVKIEKYIFILVVSILML